MISAHGQWAALRFGGQCEARTRAVGVQRGRAAALAGFTFGGAGSRQGRFYTRLSRAPRAGSTAILTIADKPFLLDVRGQWGWGRDSRQDAAIMDAARYAGSMRVQSRHPGGGRFVDRYALAGAATAMDAAAAACSLASKTR